MTEDLTAIVRRLDAIDRRQDTIERNVSDHSSSISSIVNESNRLERVLEDRTPSEDTMKWLVELRDNEVETLKALGEMGEERRKLVFDAIELTKSIRRTSRFLKWTMLGVLGLFVFANTFSEQVMKFWNLIQGAPR